MLKRFKMQDLSLAFVMKIQTEGMQPIPRRDHTALLIKNESYLLIYGGKCDQAAQLNRRDLTTLDDLMLLELRTHQWTCIKTQGFHPSPRWNAAVGYNPTGEQLYVFGGMNHAEGYCSNEVYCLELKPEIIQSKIAQIRQTNDEIMAIRKAQAKNAGRNN